MVIKIAILDVGPFLIGKSSELYYMAICLGKKCSQEIPQVMGTAGHWSRGPHKVNKGLLLHHSVWKMITVQ